MHALQEIDHRDGTVVLLSLRFGVVGRKGKKRLWLTITRYISTITMKIQYDPYSSSPLRFAPNPVSGAKVTLAC